MKQLLTAFFFLSGIFYSVAQDVELQKIESILKQQQERWNQGDLEGYMQGYLPSDSLIFIGKSGVQYGWKTTLENYRKGYPDKASMGILHFEIIETRALSPEYYSMIGKWSLQRDKGNLSGHFSLIWKKINHEWKIVIDHSS